MNWRIRENVIGLVSIHKNLIGWDEKITLACLSGRMVSKSPNCMKVEEQANYLFDFGAVEVTRKAGEIHIMLGGKQTLVPRGKIYVAPEKDGLFENEFDGYFNHHAEAERMQGR